MADPTALARKLEENVARVILGKEEAVRRALLAVFCRGHLLIEDVPGVGKTMLARAIAKSVRATFKRIQFTPDLLPSDLTGVTIYDPKTGEFRFREGPLFAHILLADEINRASPRTQSALLECMEERQVTVDGTSRKLDEPFFVLATQNPIEQEGTYPLPEAQLDRFLVRIRLGYVSPEVEVRMLGEQVERHPIDALEPVMSPEELLEVQVAVRKVHVDPAIREYAVRIADETRRHDDILLGASPRGSLGLMRCAQGMALLDGADFVVPQQVKEIAPAVLAHRILLTPQARLGGLDPERAIADLLDRVPVPTASEGSPG